MMCRNRTVSTFLIAFLALPMLGGEVLKCSLKELPGHSFRSKGLTIRITELTGYKAFDRERKFSGRARAAILIENKGDDFQKFEPQDLSFVGKDGLQVFPIFERLSLQELPRSAVQKAECSRPRLKAFDSEDNLLARQAPIDQAVRLLQ